MQFEQLTAGHGALTGCAHVLWARPRRAVSPFLVDRHAFDPVLEAFAANHRVTVFNLPGFHGLRSSPRKAGVSMDVDIASHRRRLPGMENRQ